jgi:hypothetical protein
MYFEPAKKNYHRFPSLRSVNDFDSRYNFPDKTHAAAEDMRFEEQLASTSDYRDKPYPINTR